MDNGITFSVPIDRETLAPDEIEEITGRARRDQQAQWLTDHGWRFDRNASGVPIVGRLYARFKLAGIELSTAVVSPSGLPDFSKVR
jgi:hypothetical protein